MEGRANLQLAYLHLIKNIVEYLLYLNFIKRITYREITRITAERARHKPQADRRNLVGPTNINARNRLHRKEARAYFRIVFRKRK